MLACLYVPLFPLAARLRSEPDVKGEAAAVFEGNGNAARVVAATRKARKAGIEAGMTLPQARSIYPRLLARARDLESERAAREALLEIAETFSPRVEDAGEGVVYLDLDGIPALACGESCQLSALSSQPDSDPSVPPRHPERSEGSSPVDSQLTTHNSQLTTSLLSFAALSSPPSKRPHCRFAPASRPPSSPPASPPASRTPP